MTQQEYLLGLGSVYHLTQASTNENILKEGLKPQRIHVRKNDRDNFEEIVCLSIPAFRTKWLQQMQDRCPQEDTVLLRIDCRALSLLKCSLDYSSDETHFLISKFETDDFETIVEKSGDFACLELIRPQSISVDAIMKRPPSTGT